MFSILHVILKNRPRMSAEKAMRNKQMKMPDAKLQFSPWKVNSFEETSEDWI